MILKRSLIRSDLNFVPATWHLQSNQPRVFREIFLAKFRGQGTFWKPREENFFHHDLEEEPLVLLCSDVDILQLLRLTLDYLDGSIEILVQIRNRLCGNE